MSQRSFLSGEEFDFDEHKQHQRLIALVEQRAGLSFGPLATLDPLQEMDEATPTLPTDPSQIVFRR